MTPRKGVCKRLGGNTAKTPDPGWPKGCSILYDVLSHDSWEKGEGCKGISSDGIYLTEQLLRRLRKWLDTCLLMGSSEYISYFALPQYEVFAFFIKLFLSWPRSFFHLFFSWAICFVVGRGGETSWVGISQPACDNIWALTENSCQTRLQIHTLSSLSLPMQTWFLNVAWGREARYIKEKVL